MLVIMAGDLGESVEDVGHVLHLARQLEVPRPEPLRHLPGWGFGIRVCHRHEGTVRRRVPRIFQLRGIHEIHTIGSYGLST